jgi:hypothetical protein
MRSIGAGFGIVAFLIAIAISLWMWATYTKEVAHYGTKATAQAQRYSGHDENGRIASKSLKMKPEVQNGRLKYVLVESIDPQGAYAKWYHLQQNDQIVAAGPMGEFLNEDGEMAVALISESYQREWELTVWRNGKKIVLPEGRVLDETSSLFSDNSTSGQGTQPAKQDERAVPKELSPLRGIIR